jgi:hypothetical protein
MTTGADGSGAVTDRVVGWAREQADEYRDGADRPLGGYLAVLGVYTGGVGALAALGRLLGRRIPDRFGPLDLVVMSIATHRLSRTLAKDPIISPLRAPFTKYRGTGGAAELAEEVRTHNELQHSVGELINCPLCLAQWVATALSAGMVFAPRQTRIVMATLTAVAGADFLQYAYALIQQASE